MGKYLNKEHIKVDSKYSALFIPGFPGQYKDRPLTEDLKKLNFDIYSITYPGTNGKSGTFSPKSTIEVIEEAISELNKTKKPLVVITYSYSTYFILSLIPKINNLIGLFLFSPIIDFKETLNVNFLDQIKEVSIQSGYTIDISSFDQLINDKSINKINFLKRLEDATDSTKSPMVFISGKEDRVVKQDEVHDVLSQFRNKNGLNKLMQIKIEGANHSLDSLYENRIVYKILAALVFSFEAKKLFPDLSSFLWGATLNYRYSNINSDVDLVLLGKRFNYKDYTTLNVMKNRFSKGNLVNLDLILNTYDELKTDERIRSNRGPLFVHLLSYYYLPLITNKEFLSRQVDKKILNEDILFANNLNFYKSKKALLNYEPDTSESKWIIKNFIMGCIYYQILIDNLKPDLNQIEQYFASNKSVYKLLVKCKELKQSGVEKVDLDFLQSIVEAHEKLYKKYYLSAGK